MLKPDQDILKALSNRRQTMDAEYSFWQPQFREIRDAIMPSRGRFSFSDKPAKTSLNKQIIDGTAKQALKTFASGMMAGVTSPSRPWFRIGISGIDVNDDHEVRSWAHTVERRMYEVMRQSNIYRMFATTYTDLGLFGTFAGMIVSDFEDVIFGHSFQVGSYRIAVDDKGNCSALHRDFKMPVSAAAERFGRDRLSQAARNILKRSPHEMIKIHHAVERRAESDPTSLMPRDWEWGAYYWEEGENRLLNVSGHSIAPLLVPRWEQSEGESWSISSPGMDALGDAKALQVQQRNKLIAIEKMHNPPMQQGASDSNAKSVFRNVPGGMTTLSTTDLQKGGMRPAYEVRPDIAALLSDIQETQHRVKRAFHEDLFLMATTALSDRHQVTAREIAERHEEKLLTLGPVLESLDHGLLQPVIEATFHFMQKARIIPPAPKAIVGKPMKIEYISLLAQAQRAIGVGAIERTIGFAGTLAQLQPDVLDNLDGDQMLREFSNLVGPPPAILKDQKKVDEQRKARAEAEQMAAMAEQAQPMAGAAKLIADASATGQEALQRGSPL